MLEGLVGNLTNFMVIRFGRNLGRFLTWVVLLAPLILLPILAGEVWVILAHREADQQAAAAADAQATRLATEDAAVITPAEAISEGCCTVTVVVRQPDSNFAVGGGWYEVITTAGRRPDPAHGEWTAPDDWEDGRLQVYVGREWIGQIRVSTGQSVPAWLTTDLIGGPYGWHDREVQIS